VTDQLPLRYWKAVADLPVHRNDALIELDDVFTEGALPEGLSGPYRGRLLTTTFGYGLDALFMHMTRVWMPWKGKSIDRDSKEGRNLFSREFRAAMRVLWPGYDDVRDEEAGRLSTFRFNTWDGPSATSPGTNVFKIDYDHDQSPPLLIRPILDELVQIDAGLCLGQALMSRKGVFHRVAWFSLSA